MTNTGTFITGDAIASAVMHYARSLAATGRVDLVSIPTVDAHGVRGSTDLLLVPTSGLMSSPYPTDLAEVEDESFVADLAARAQTIVSPRYIGKPLAYDESELWEHPGV